MEYKYDVIFTGSYNYHPEYQYRKQLIDWLATTYGSRFRRFAGDVPPEGTVRGDRLNRLYASTKVVVGDTLCPDFSKSNYFSDRLFEVTGRGGFIIFPYIKGLEDMFILHESFDSRNHVKGLPVELITYQYGNFEQLKDLIDYFLTHDEEREAIRLAGHERAKKDHTYTQRLTYLLNTIFPNGTK